MQKYAVIITTFKEPKTIGKAIKQVVIPNRDILDHISLIIVATDEKTIKAAKETITELKIKEFEIIKDKGTGKPAALNLAVKSKLAINRTLILTDGDVYVSDNSIKELINTIEKKDLQIVSGHPISLENRKKMFGFYSHLFCSAADYKRKNEENTPASGYLYAIKDWTIIFPIPENLRAEDAYISQKYVDNGFNIGYNEKATVNVHFPKNTKDWINQKTRSLGGNVQLHNFKTKKTRSIKEDIKMALYPIMFASTPMEYIYLKYLYPLRLYLWLKIYFLNKFNKLGTGRWESIKSSKN